MNTNKVWVLLPVSVPDSDYCWKHSEIDAPICEHFDNEGRHSFCSLFKESLHRCEAKEGVKKLAVCAKLEKAPEMTLSQFMK